MCKPTNITGLSSFGCTYTGPPVSLAECRDVHIMKIQPAKLTNNHSYGKPHAIKPFPEFEINHDKSKYEIWFLAFSSLLALKLG